MSDYKMNKASYLFAHSTAVTRLTNIPHKHAGIEIFIMLEGNSDCYIEGNKYSLANGDIVIINEDEQHFFEVKTRDFNHIVIGLTNAFFKENDCSTYADMFFNRNLGKNNLLSSGPLIQYGAHEILSRMENYLREDCAPENVIMACLTEFLYACHKAYANTYQQDTPHSELMYKIISYIDHNLTANLTLKSISDHFFISRQYLCRIFKKSTGLTVNEYITHKRMILYHQLTAKGANVQSASELAGFGSYSAFFRAYKKAYSVSPKKNK